MSEDVTRSSGVLLPLGGLEPQTQASGENGGGIEVYHDVPGPLPLADKTFETVGGILMITCSGSGSAPQAPDTIGMAISINKRFAGMAYTTAHTTETQFFSNTFSFGPVLPGQHTMAVTPLGNTQTSGEDIFNVSVSVIELRERRRDAPES